MSCERDLLLDRLNMLKRVSPDVFKIYLHSTKIDQPWVVYKCCFDSYDAAIKYIKNFCLDDIGELDLLVIPVLSLKRIEMKFEVVTPGNILYDRTS
jgi:hypothetical protein